MTSNNNLQSENDKEFNACPEKTAKSKKSKNWFARHWIDISVIIAVVSALCFLGYVIYKKFKFAKKIKIFYEYFVVAEGYEKLREGMQNTAIIAISGLLGAFTNILPIG